MKENRLFIEVSASGHRVEYMQNLVDYSRNTKADNMFFLLSPDFEEKLINLDGVNNVFYFNNFSVTNNKLVKFVKYFLMFIYAIKFSRIKEIKHITFMFLNEFYLVAYFSPKDINISGIAFHTNYRKKSKLGFLAKIKEYLFFTFAKKRNVKKIFVLNDDECAARYNEKCNKNVFSCLVDPVTSFVDSESRGILESYRKQYSDTKLNMLHAGVLSHRKGTDIFIASLNLLPKHVSSGLRIFIVGRPVKQFMDDFQSLIESVTSDIDIVTISDFVSNAELQAFIELSDAVVLPYRNTESSSGMIVRGMLENKYIFAPNEGLIFNILKKYNLYIPVSNYVPSTLANSVEMFYEKCKSSKEHNCKLPGFSSTADYNNYKTQVDPSFFVLRLVADE